MRTEISGGIRDLIDGGAAPVTLAEIDSQPVPRRTPGRRHWPGRPDRIAARPGRIAAMTAGAAALACAAAVSATQLTGTAAHPPAREKIILTAATVRRVASRSRAALASDGRAEISYRDSQDGVLQDSGTDDITFAGQNWNDAFTQTVPASDGQPADTEFAINRIVNGQAYYYIKGRTSSLEWYHDTNPANHPGITIPDPRTALSVLEPAVRFQVTGYQTLAGLRLEVLRATMLSHLPGLTALPDVQPGEHVTALRVWVDPDGVVRRMALSLQQTSVVYSFRLAELKGVKYAIINGHRAITLQKLEALLREARREHPGRSTVLGAGRREVQATTLTVTFLDIGQREVIKAPPHSIPEYGLG